MPLSISLPTLQAELILKSCITLNFVPLSTTELNYMTESQLNVDYYKCVREEPPLVISTSVLLEHLGT